MKQIPILASKKDTVSPRIGGQTACSLCTIGKGQTTNQTYIYVMVIEDDKDQERNEEGIHPNN